MAEVYAKCCIDVCIAVWLNQASRHKNKALSMLLEKSRTIFYSKFTSQRRKIIFFDNYEQKASGFHKFSNLQKSKKKCRSLHCANVTENGTLGCR